MLLIAILLQSMPGQLNERPVLLRLTEPPREREADRESRRYRLDTEPVREEDPQVAILRGVWKPCGITGAPVCPSRGKLKFHAKLEPPE